MAGTSAEARVKPKGLFDWLDALANVRAIELETTHYKAAVAPYPCALRL